MSLILKKGFKQSDEKINYKKVTINEILSLDEIDTDKVNNNDTSRKIYHFSSSVLEQLKRLERN